MIPEPKIFYKTYLDDFHKFKAIIYKKILEDPIKYEVEFFGEELQKEASDAFRRTLKSDLRQTYFHAIETFFEMFFALVPNDTPNFDDENILFNLTHSNWRETYNKIKKIALGEFSLDFLEKEITVASHKILVGHYLFYYGAFDNSKFPSVFFDKVKESIEAIKFGIKIIAQDFVDREEYNSYKHGLRIIPAVSEIMFADPKTMEIKVRWDLTDAMSFYCKTKNDEELKIVTKLFDMKRDFCMIHFCSNMISHMVYYRQVTMYKEQKTPSEGIPLLFFGKKEIEDCNNINVSIQDIVYTIRRVHPEKQGGS